MEKRKRRRNVQFSSRRKGEKGGKGILFSWVGREKEHRVLRKKGKRGKGPLLLREKERKERFSSTDAKEGILEEEKRMTKEEGEKKKREEESDVHVLYPTFSGKKKRGGRANAMNPDQFGALRRDQWPLGKKKGGERKGACI